VDQLNALLWAGLNGMPPTPDTLHLGCSYHLHSSHCFLSTWGAGMLVTTQEERKKIKVMLRKATKVHVCVQCFSLLFQAWKDLKFDWIQLSLKYHQLKG